MSSEIRPDQQVILTRVLRHPPATVYAAWTRPEQIERWLKPTTDTQLEADVDCRVGGHLTFIFHDPDGSIHRVEGTYLVVRPAERLVFTWVWKSSAALPGAPPLPLPLDAIGVETLVTIDFATHPNGTLLTIAHQRFASGSEAERHRMGWTGALEQLPALLDSHPGEGS